MAFAAPYQYCNASNKKNIFSTNTSIAKKELNLHMLKSCYRGHINYRTIVARCAAIHY